VFKTFLYGDRAHANPAKSARLKEWKADKLMFQFLEYSFTRTIVCIVEAISRVSELTKLELAGKDIDPFPG
jgi:hypothetical protein